MTKRPPRCWRAAQPAAVANPANVRPRRPSSAPATISRASRSGSVTGWTVATAETGMVGRSWPCRGPPMREPDNPTLPREMTVRSVAKVASHPRPRSLLRSSRPPIGAKRGSAAVVCGEDEPVSRSGEGLPKRFRSRRRLEEGPRVRCGRDLQDPDPVRDGSGRLEQTGFFFFFFRTRHGASPDHIGNPSARIGPSPAHGTVGGGLVRPAVPMAKSSLMSLGVPSEVGPATSGHRPPAGSRA